MICVLQSNMISNSDLRDMVMETRRRVRLAMISVSHLELRQHLYDLLQGNILSDDTHTSFTQTVLCYVQQCNARCYSNLPRMLGPCILV
jgi:hypothetical protein